MNLEYFIARRISFSPRGSLSRFIIIMTVIAVALSLAVMIIATAMVSGFQHEISRKVFGFNGNIQVTAYDPEIIPYSENPMFIDRAVIRKIEELDEVEAVQAVATKIGVLKSGNDEYDDIEGIIFKGAGDDFRWDIFDQYMLSGKVFPKPDSPLAKPILVSRITADRLQLEVGQKVFGYFIDHSARVSRLRVYDFTVYGIYNTGLTEYDRKYALIRIDRIQQMNNWCDGRAEQNNSNRICIDSVNALEIFLRPGSDPDSVAGRIESFLPLSLFVTPLTKINPNIFDWLNLQSLNEIIIITIMIIMAIINMATSLLILILERTTLIGLLKSLGASGRSIVRIFLLNAAVILAAGLLAGNILGLGICFLQQEFSIIRLPEESYYVSEAPVLINWWWIVLLNLGTLAVCIISQIVPALFVYRVKPVDALRWE